MLPSCGVPSKRMVRQGVGVQLAASHDVLSETAGAKRATGGLLQGSSYVSLALGVPVPGHEYEAVLAYTRKAGSSLR